MLGWRRPDYYKALIGMLFGASIAIPVNVINLTNWRFPIILGYVFAVVAIGTAVFRNRPIVVGFGTTLTIISLPQAIASLLPTPGPVWKIATGLVWLLVVSIVATLYLIREAEARLNADVSLRWLFHPRR